MIWNNHPPIPPKIEKIGSCRIRIIRKDPRGRKFYKDFSFAYGPERVVTSAYLEVEWTKRAERASKIAAFYSNFLNCPDAPRNECRRNRLVWLMSECRKNANAWREWGSNE